MKGFVNRPENVVEDMINGYLSVYPRYFTRVDGKNQKPNGFIRQNCPDKVSIVIGGGAGNEPWSIGFVGRGLADGVATGAVFTAPPSRSIFNVTRALPNKNGVLYICTNHAGDILNFELAGELAELEGIETRCVKVSDDISGLLGETKEERRGQAGVAFVIKIAGAATEAGCSLQEVTRIAQKVNLRTCTFGVTVSSGYMPGSGETVYEMRDGEAEYGKGFNGENSMFIEKDKCADEIITTLMSCLMKEVQLTSLDEIAVLINAYGYTSSMEQYIISKRVVEILSSEGVKIHHIIVDKLFSPLSGGCSVSISKLDEELKRFYDMPAESPLVKCW